jgi:ectoine hydroxylase-related dioxygenase (phytanoyl-CoA dioxygenase family)
MALDDVTTENSCVQLIPGSHTRTHRMVKSPPGMEFSEMTDPDAVDPSKAINMVLKPGEFFIFNERILHHSDANHSNKRRMCFVIRMTVPFVKIPPLFPGHKLMMVSGEDRFGINEYGQPFPRE